MSLILQELTSWVQDSEVQGKKPTHACSGVLASDKCFQKFDTCMTKHLNRHRNFATTFISEDRDSKTYGVYLQNISQYFTGLLTFVFKKKSKLVSVFYHFLDKSGQYLKVSGVNMFNQVFRATFLNPQAHRNSVKLLLNSENGNVCLQICYFSAIGSNLIQDMDQGYLFRTKNLILDLYRNFVERFIPVFQQALKISVPLERRTEIEESSKLKENILRYAKMMTSKVYLSSVVVESEEIRVNQLKQRQESGRKLLERRINLEQRLTKSFGLFGILATKIQKKSSKGSHEFHISLSEEKQLVSVIALGDHKANETQLNAHLNILNYIKINQPESMVTYPLNAGGFSFLESTEVNFWYVDSYRNKEDIEMNPKHLERKFLAIKRENRPHGKNKHEYKILTEMRNGINPLFPKYYIPLNIPGYDLNDNPLLMMSLQTDGNLSEYMRARKNSISLLSKLYLLFSVTMGLRYLETYKIVHLDIKPNNIMIAPGLLVKIIDFGEAFHPAVWKSQGKSYRPGFTLPYSPPQFGIGMRQGFTSKADVYSFGVMMFEILYGKVPFENREKMFLAAQNCDLYGDPVMMRILNWMISRCVSRNPDHRPQLDWISIILRLSLEVIT